MGSGFTLRMRSTAMNTSCMLRHVLLMIINVRLVVQRTLKISRHTLCINSHHWWFSSFPRMNRGMYQKHTLGQSSRSFTSRNPSRDAIDAMQNSAICITRSVRRSRPELPLAFQSIHNLNASIQEGKKSRFENYFRNLVVLSKETPGVEYCKLKINDRKLKKAQTTSLQKQLKMNKKNKLKMRRSEICRCFLTPYVHRVIYVKLVFKLMIRYYVEFVIIGSQLLLTFTIIALRLQVLM